MAGKVIFPVWWYCSPAFNVAGWLLLAHSAIQQPVSGASNLPCTFFLVLMTDSLQNLGAASISAPHVPSSPSFGACSN